MIEFDFSYGMMVGNQATVVTWGCSHNQKDSQLIEQQLILGGYHLLPEDNIETADLVVFNTCTVKTPTEDKILHVLDTYKNSDKQVIVAGCLSQAEPELIKDRYPDFTVLGVNAAAKILEVIREPPNKLIPLTNLSDKRNMRDNKKNWTDKPMMESTQWNPHLNIVQINEGCLNFCTFCATKKARGHLRSYSKESIIHSIRSVPTPEVWLTSQDTACWGFDINQNLADLLNEIDKIERKFWVRVGMGNPNNLIKFVDQAVEAFKSEKVYKFLHLPVQAGGNDVLLHMRRGYTVEEYELIVDRFRSAIPEITLATDIICGYPTETEDDFERTVETVLKTRPSVTNISRYWERRGTPAAELPQLSFEERKRRSGRLAKLCKSMQREDNQHWIGWEGEVYLAELGSKGGVQARNLAYKPVIVHGVEDRIGQWTDIRITNAHTTYFEGELL